MWFRDNSVDPENIIRISSWNMPDNVEHSIGSIPSSQLQFQGSITRSNGYCFLKLSRNGKDFKFFFKCSALITGEVYFRILGDECPYPPTNPPSPPSEQVCYLYAKRAAETVSNLVTAIGEKGAKGFLSCYISVLETVKPGNLESMCTRQGAGAEWHSITKQDLREAAQNSVQTWTDDKGITHYEFKEEKTTEIIKAK